MGYTLYYFPLRVLGEPLRQLFKIAGKDFENKRITFEEWIAEYKPKMPFNQMPVVELEDGTKIAQSAAIARYLGKEFGGILWGKNGLEAQRVDALIDQYKDYYNEIRQFYYTSLGVLQGNLDELYESVLVPAADKFFSHIEDRLAQEDGFLIGSEISYADLIVCDHMVTLNNLRPEYLKKFPKILEYQAKVYSNPILKQWLQERPEDKM